MYMHHRNSRFERGRKCHSRVTSLWGNILPPFSYLFASFIDSCTHHISRARKRRLSRRGNDALVHGRRIRGPHAPWHLESQATGSVGRSRNVGTAETAGSVVSARWTGGRRFFLPWLWLCRRSPRRRRMQSRVSRPGGSRDSVGQIRTAIPDTLAQRESLAVTGLAGRRFLGIHSKSRQAGRKSR